MTDTIQEIPTEPVLKPVLEEPESFAFSTDINQLLSLIINTFYSNKDVFLRELISNASDALDKVRYQSLTDASVLESEEKMEIRLIPNKEAGTLTIEDTGVGMSRSDLVNNLGTIARSGTKAFMEALEGGADISMIGQFGVGFYSSYLVADRVTVSSKSNDDEIHTWDSTAGGSFTVSNGSTTGDLTRGTRITLHLKDDMTKYLKEDKLKELVKRHSEFVDFPIQLWTEKTEEKEVTESDDDVDEDDKADDKADDKEEDDKVEVEDVTVDDEVSDDEKEKVKKTKKVQEVTNDWDHLNSVRPIWLRKPEDVTQEEHASFYKSVAGDWEEHLAVKHFSVEGQLEFKALLYLPKKAPMDMFNPGEKKKKNIKLYVRRVFITDESEELLPEWLRFLKGVVDSDDLPLNISREMLQQNRIMRVIKKSLVKKSIELFNELAEDDEKYKSFYSSFAKNIKLGIHEDAGNRQKLAKLLRYKSTHDTNDHSVSFEDYVSRMKEGQKGIYYIIGESMESIAESPFLEVLRKRGLEVLFMTDAIDEYSVQQLKDFDGKNLICVTKEGLDLGDTDDEKKAFDALKEKCKPLCEKIHKILEGQIEKAVVSNRIVDSPCCLVTAEYGWSANMERIMKAQALGDSSQQMSMAAKKTMEINPGHPIIKKLLDSNDTDNVHKDLIWLMYESSLLNSGFTLPRPTHFTNRINRLVSLGLGLENQEDDEGEDIPDEVEEVSNDDGDDDGMEEID